MDNHIALQCLTYELLNVNWVEDRFSGGKEIRADKIYDQPEIQRHSKQSENKGNNSR